MSKPKILLLNPTCMDVVQSQRDWVDVLEANVIWHEDWRKLGQETADDVVAGAHGLILPSGIAGFPDEEFMERHASLRVLSIAASGFDWLDVEAATGHGIVVTNAPVAEGAEVVADLALGLMIGVARKIPHHDRQLCAGDTTRGMGTSLWKKTLGIVGFGQIGRAVARRARGFDMRIVTSSLPRDARSAQELGVEMVSLETLLRESDFISLHLRLDETTCGIIGREELARCKPSAILINTARRELVDEESLVEAISAGRIAGAGLDDPPTKISASLMGTPNVVFTPHLGNRAVEGVVAVFRCALENAVAVVQGRKPPFVVNPQVFESRQFRGGARS